jgi:HSP20 family molecular chaperone IbpA
MRDFSLLAATIMSQQSQLYNYIDKEKTLTFELKQPNIMEKNIVVRTSVVFALVNNRVLLRCREKTKEYYYVKKERKYQQYSRRLALP